MSVNSTESIICTRCVMDTTVPEIRFDQEGVCHFCHIHDAMEKEFPLNEEGQKHFQKIISQVKSAGKGREHDIVIGVSGGRDSTYALYQAVKMGLRPLAVHFDNGWNSEIAVTNIKNAVEKLGVDLYTYVIDWEEFKDLQKSFLSASVSDAEIPTDVAIHGTLHKVAAQHGIRYLVFAHSFRTEGVAPLTWTYMDGKYINSVHKKFGTKKLKTYPNMTLTDLLYYKVIKRIKVVPLLVYLPYDQQSVMKMLEQELGWQYYGGHHHESYFTHFFQSYYLPKKFNIDKRKIEYSALIRSGQMSREAALKEIQSTAYPYEQEVVEYAMKKLGLSSHEFESMMKAETKSFYDYPTYYPLIKAMQRPLKLAAKWKIVSPHLITKFLG